MLLWYNTLLWPQIPSKFQFGCERFLFLIIIYLWLCGFLVAACRFSLVATSSSYSLVATLVFLTAVASLVAPGFCSTGSTVMTCGLRCSSACGIFPHQGSTCIPCTGRRILNHWPTREVLRTISGWQFLPRPWTQFRLMPCIVVHISLVSFSLDQLLNFCLGNISASKVFSPVVLENVPLPWFVWYFLMIEFWICIWDRHATQVTLGPQCLPWEGTWSLWC